MFIIAFIIHITFIAYFLKHPIYPSIKVYQQNFDKTEFPLSFKICLRKLKDQTEIYENLGYKDVKNFFRGASIFGENQFGWKGHGKDNLTVKGLKSKANMCRNQKAKFYFQR